MRNRALFALLLALAWLPAPLSAQDSPDSPPPASPAFDVHGWASYGVDATFWWLDDSFSANLIEMTTERSTPVFHDFKFHLSRFYGFDINLDFSLDNMLNPAEVFTGSLGQAGTSGGFQTLITYPVADLLSRWLDTDMDDFSPQFQLEYKYRLFRWDNKIDSVWLDSDADYYDENGTRHVYPTGTKFSTGSRWNNLFAGLQFGIPELDGLAFYTGLEWWSLQAPTLVSLMIRDSWSSPMADVIMQTKNDFLGLRIKMLGGIDPNNTENLPEEPTFGVDFGGTFGWYSGSNDYFQGPSEFSSTMFGGGSLGFSFKPWEGAKGFFLAGVESTFSLMMSFGSASEPGTIKKTFTFRDLGSDNTFAAGTKVDVDLSRWETYTIPYFKAGLRF